MTNILQITIPRELIGVEPWNCGGNGVEKWNTKPQNGFDSEDDTSASEGCRNASQ